MSESGLLRAKHAAKGCLMDILGKVWAQSGIPTLFVCVMGTGITGVEAVIFMEPAGQEGPNFLRTGTWTESQLHCRQWLMNRMRYARTRLVAGVRSDFTKR